MFKIDFFSETPNESTKYIVRKYTKDLVDIILKDISDFALKSHLKEKCLC